jgi:ribosomal subunit interface protein
MINKLEINGVHTVATDELKKYIIRKIGRLDRYIPRSIRESAHAEVFLKEGNAKDKNKCTCEVVLTLPHDRITIKESTMNMFAAVDIVEVKLRNQLKKYKETHYSARLHRRLFARLRRRPAPAS